MNLFPVFYQGQVLEGFVQINDLVNVTLPEGTLSIRPLTENAVRIKFYKETEPSVPELIFTSSVPTPVFQVAINLSPAAFEFFNTASGKMTVTAGEYKVWYGNSSDTRDLKMTKIMVR